MPIQPPHPPANVGAVPAPQDPPTLQDVNNAIKYVEQVNVDHRALTPGYATMDDMRTALDSLEDRMNTKIDQVKADLTMKIDQVDTKVDQMQVDLYHVKVELREAARTANAVYNMQCGDGRNIPYKIVRFLDGTSPNDHVPALHTTQAICDLGTRDIEKYMEGYGLPSSSPDHKRAIATFIGCSVDL